MIMMMMSMTTGIRMTRITINFLKMTLTMLIKKYII